MTKEFLNVKRPKLEINILKFYWIFIVSSTVYLVLTFQTTKNKRGLRLMASALVCFILTLRVAKKKMTEGGKSQIEFTKMLPKTRSSLVSAVRRVLFGLLKGVVTIYSLDTLTQ